MVEHTNERKGSSQVSPRLGIVLVNWNRWADTLECLESVLRSSVPVQVVVVDNASSDGSGDQIAAWAAGERLAEASSAALAPLSTPPLPKPVKLVRLDGAASAETDPVDGAVTLIEAANNRGFAAGNNIGLRHLLRAPGIDYVWLLNNDTVIEPQAANALIVRMDATHKVGMCGTVVRFYHRPDTIQSLNGNRFSSLTGQSRGINAGHKVGTPYDPAKVARETDFVLGASLAVSRQFIATVGLMAEDYFLYYEEIDWSSRNAGRFKIAFAHGAVVYHKEGGSIGSSRVKGQRSAASDYYLLRSRLKFVRKQQPLLLPVHWLLATGQIARRVLRMQPKKALVLTRALFGLRPDKQTRV